MIRKFKASAPIPFSSEGQEWFLPLLLGLMQYLLGLLLIAFLMFHGIVQRWDIVLRNHLTLEVLESDKDALDSMVTFVQANPAVESVKLVSDKQLAVTLQPWLGNVADDIISGLPLPHLIDIEIKPGKTLDAEALLLQLRQKFPDQAIDFSNSWVNDILALVKGLRALASVLLGLLSAIVIVTVIFVVRSRLRSHYDEVDLLHIMGASDSFISRLLQRQILWAAVKGSLVALLCFALTLLLLAGFTVVHQNDFFMNAIVPFQAMGLPMMIALCALPVIFLAVAAVTSRISILHALRQLY